MQTIFWTLLSLVVSTSSAAALEPLKLPKTAEGIFFAKGIPYAAAPVGTRRWKPPIDVEFDANALGKMSFSPSCMPHEQNPWDTLYGDEISEDCLFLNIWTPSPQKKFPVMVWIHGGGFKNGNGNIAGDLLAQHDVVVVSLNYRLGLLGFFPHHKLIGQDTNFGFLDQISALRWVKANIQTFGGDPDNITIFGNSAGAFSVDALTNHPSAVGLFNRAIAQSTLIAQSVHLVSSLAPLRTNDLYGNPRASAHAKLRSDLTHIGLHGDESIRQLRAIEPEFFVANPRDIRPTINNISLRADHFRCVRDPNCGSKLDSYMTGATSYEGKDMDRYIKPNMAWYESQRKTLAAVYQNDFSINDNVAFRRFTGDLWFLLSAELSASAHREAGSTVFTYYTDAALLEEYGRQLGTPHGWDNTGLWQKPTDGILQLLQSHYHENWSRFAHGKALVGNGQWPSWKKGAPYWQILGRKGGDASALLAPRLKISDFYYRQQDPLRK